MKKENIDYMGLNAPMVVVLLLITSFVMLSMFAGVGHATWYDNNALQRINFSYQNTTGVDVGNVPSTLIFNFTEISNVCINQKPVIWIFSNPINTNGSHVYTNYSTPLMRVANASDNADTPFFIENNTCSDTQTFANRSPFYTNYRGVYLFGDNSVGHQENSANTIMKNGTLNGSSFGIADGYHGRGARTSGSVVAGTDVVIIPQGWGTTTGMNSQNLTVYWWAKVNTTLVATSTFMSLYNGANQCGILLQFPAVNSVRFFCQASNNSAFVDKTSYASTYVYGEWTFFAIQNDGHTGTLWINSNQVINWSNTANFDMTTSNIYLGGATGFGGLRDTASDFDEFHIMAVNTSADFIRAVYKSNLVRGGIEALNPAVTFTILDPANTTYTTLNRNLNVTYDVTVTPDKFWFKLNGGATVFFTPNTTFTVSQQGINILQVFANNSAGVLSERQVNFTIITPAPTINITAPLNITYTINNVTLKTVYATQFKDTIWYILNGGTNTTFNQNATILAIEGSNTIFVYINDSIGQTGQRNVSFTINTTAPPTPPITVETTDPNVLLFLVVLILSVVGLFWLMK